MWWAVWFSLFWAVKNQQAPAHSKLTEGDMAHSTQVFISEKSKLGISTAASRRQPCCSSQGEYLSRRGGQEREYSLPNLKSLRIAPSSTLQSSDCSFVCRSREAFVVFVTLDICRFSHPGTDWLRTEDGGQIAPIFFLFMRTKSSMLSVLICTTSWQIWTLVVCGFWAECSHFLSHFLLQL